MIKHPNNSVSETPKVHWIKPELEKVLPKYRLIEDAIEGETAVKARREYYLPIPDPTNLERENLLRYEDYLKRAVFYGVTGRTLMGLGGQVFMRPPVIELPEDLKVLEDDATGTGVPLTQQARKTLDFVLSYSRAGLFIDYPVTEGLVTKAQKDEGYIRPTIYTYHPKEIINWRVKERGAKDVLSLVVLFELYTYDDDGFQEKKAEQYRVLRLDENDEYIQEVWREREAREFSNMRTDNSSGFVTYNWFKYQVFKPTDASGKPFNELPFTFVGTSNNDPDVENPNFYDLASLNISHYRNSADLEESCYTIGQPTPVVTGLDDIWLKDQLKGKILIGSRAGIPLPVGGEATLMQAEPNGMIQAVMEHKERQMAALGAKLVESPDVQKTAFETKVEASADGSVLASSTRNVQLAFDFALKFCQKFLGSEGIEFKFELNTDFDIARMTPEEQQQAISSWEKGALGFSEMRNVLRKAGTATMKDEDVQAEALKAKEQAIELQAKQVKAVSEASPKPNGVGKEQKNSPKKSERGNNQ